MGLQHIHCLVYICPSNLNISFSLTRIALSDYSHLPFVFLPGYGYILRTPCLEDTFNFGPDHVVREDAHMKLSLSRLVMRWENKIKYSTLVVSVDLIRRN